MKNKILLTLLLLSALTTGNLSIRKVWAEPNEAHYWGLIVQAWTSCSESDFAFEGDAQYMYHLMSDHYMFDEICYLADNPGYSTLPGVTNETTKENINWAITEWLQQKSGPNDIVFIFWATHGIGYQRGMDYTSSELYRSWLKYQLDTDSGDEGDEIKESTLGFDINGDDNVTDDWVGIDEIFLVESIGTLRYQNYTDDELRLNLSTVNCDKLIFVSTSCFSGGLVDDLSAPNRIIMTTANETYPGAPPGDNKSMHLWVSHLMDALHGEEVYWNYTTRQLVHNVTSVNADFNGDGQVSLLEAWSHAWENDERRPSWETPWLDDDNNRLPTYKNGTDGGCDYGNCTDDGILANNTWLVPSYLHVKTRKTSGYDISGVKVWINGSLDYSPVITDVGTGTYNITVESSIYLGGYEYKFSFWGDDSTSNPRMLDYDLAPCYNRTITAYYHIQAGGCPFVSTWNGNEFVIGNNLLPNSASGGGTEVEDYYNLEQSRADSRVERSVYISAFDQRVSTGTLLL